MSFFSFERRSGSRIVGRNGEKRQSKDNFRTINSRHSHTYTGAKRHGCNGHEPNNINNQQITGKDLPLGET